MKFNKFNIIYCYILFLFNVGDVKLYLDRDSCNDVDNNNDDDDDVFVMFPVLVFLIVILLFADTGFSISLLLIFSLSRYLTDLPINNDDDDDDDDDNNK